MTATDTIATFQIISLLDTSSDAINFYNVDGTPNNANAISSHTFTPALVSVEPLTGSSGGAKLTITGVGFGVETTDVNLFHQESGQNICSTVEVTAYGSFLCYTIAQEITTSDTLQLVVGSSKYDCANADSSQCQYEALDASSPTITSISKTDDNTLTLTGDRLTFGNEIDCVMLGVTGVGANLATQITCTFASGVPASDAGTTPEIIFKRTVDSYDQENWAVMGDLTITNPMGTPTGNSALCSFEGGCHYEISANGLAGALAGDEDNKVMMCEQECVVDLDASTATTAKCIMPSLMTTYSAREFDMGSHAPLELTWTGTGSASELAKLSDGDNLDDYSDSTNPCNFEISAESGYVYQISEAKVFINNLLDKTPYDQYLFFEGSDESKTSWTRIYTFDYDIHEGWNSIVAEEDAPYSYNSFRFYGESVGACRVGEVKLIGLKVWDDDNAIADCSPVLTYEGQDFDLTQVSYSDVATPALTAVNPRFSSVYGGELVTFTGTGFSDSATTTILIETRPCTVQSQSTTEITCITADRPYVAGREPSLSIHFDDIGYVATRGLLHRYVDLWSDRRTWSGGFLPLAGDAIDIPAGQTLLVDVDSTPVLSFISVSGAMIFAPDDDPTHERTFDATYVIVNGGYLEIGTEEFPYTSKLTITMHGDERTPALPIYGNKVIAIRFGRLEMHGPPRSHVWTDIGSTANAGDSCITLSDMVDGAELDW